MTVIKKKYLFIIVLLSFVISILVGCSSQRSYKVMSFFFDGVPDPLKTEEKSDTNKTTTNADTLTHKELANKSGNSKINFHPPYQERNCDVCHDKNATGKLMKPQTESCYSCHDDFAKKYKAVHGPVASGYCTTCHNPHMSAEAKFLKRIGQQLCFYCHSPEQVLKNEAHSDIKDTYCVECHNPHGGDDRTMLK